MRTYPGLLTNAVRSALRSKHDLMLENLALRQQLAVLTRQRARTRTKPADRLFWSWLSRYWPGSRSTLVIVQPETAIRWHRTAWRGYWTWKSRARHPGRRRISKERQGLIARSATENPRWGAVRIEGELLALGYEVSAETVRCYRRRALRPPPSQSWRTFLANHRPQLWACGLLHRPHAHLQDAVRLLLHHARAPPHRAFQRDGTEPRVLYVWCWTSWFARRPRPSTSDLARSNADKGEAASRSVPPSMRSLSYSRTVGAPTRSAGGWQHEQAPPTWTRLRGCSRRRPGAPSRTSARGRAKRPACDPGQRLGRGVLVALGSGDELGRADGARFEVAPDGIGARERELGGDGCHGVRSRPASGERRWCISSAKRDTSAASRKRSRRPS